MARYSAALLPERVVAKPLGDVTIRIEQRKDERGGSDYNTEKFPSVYISPSPSKRSKLIAMIATFSPQQLRSACA